MDPGTAGQARTPTLHAAQSLIIQNQAERDCPGEMQLFCHPVPHYKYAPF